MAREMTRTMYEACKRVRASPGGWRGLHHLTKRGLLAHQWVRPQSNGTAQITEAGERMMSESAAFYETATTRAD